MQQVKTKFASLDLLFNLFFRAKLDYEFEQFICGLQDEDEWIRTCDYDNTFARVQSKTNVANPLNRQWCADPEGNRSVQTAGP